MRAPVVRGAIVVGLIVACAAALIVGFSSAKFLSADAGTVAANRRASNSTANARTTIIHKNINGPWPDGEMWVGTKDCAQRRFTLGSNECVIVINTTAGIDI